MEHIWEVVRPHGTLLSGALFGAGWCAARLPQWSTATRAASLAACVGAARQHRAVGCRACSCPANIPSQLARAAARMCPSSRTLTPARHTHPNTHKHAPPRWVFADALVAAAAAKAPFAFHYCLPGIVATLGVVLLGAAGGEEQDSYYVDEAEACRGKCVLFLSVSEPEGGVARRGGW